jgi:AraC-like DNA-binding protein
MDLHKTTFKVQFFCQISIILLFLYSCNYKEKEDIVFDDFENGLFQKWDVQGSSFNNPIHIDSTRVKIENAHGKYIAFSNFRATTQTNSREGKLISNKFVIDRNHIVFSIAGGKHATRACVNLIINNKVVRIATGKNDAVLRRIVWDVTEFIGKEAIIEVVDALGHPISNATILPYIMVDYFLFIDTINLNEIIFEDFESGVYTNWIVTGEAFPTPRNRKNVYYPISANGFNGNYFAFSFGDAHDEKQGKLTSSLFTVKKDYIRFLVGGGNIKGKTCINLIVDDSIVFSSTGENDGQLRHHEWYVAHLKNKTARIEIVDNFSGSWGHIMVDEIVFYNKEAWYQKFWLIGLLLIIIIFVFIKYLKNYSKKKVPLDLSSEDSFRLINLKEYIKDSKEYVNSNYSISDVIKSSGYTEKEIVFLFTKSEFLNIFNYINYLRVEYFKQEIMNPHNKNYTMISISEKSGFGSKTSFYRNFKLFTDMTPSEFIKKNKK